MRFRALDGWRGLAALFVALYHLEFLNHIYDTSFLRNSYLFVDFFFVLSGFVITHAYQNKLNNIDQGITFVSNRISRLWSLHLFILALFIGLELTKLLLFHTGNWSSDTQPFTEQYSLFSLFTNIFLIQSLGMHNQLTWNYPSWSISVEFFTYLIFMSVTLISQKKNLIKYFLYAALIGASFYILYSETENIGGASFKNGLFRCIPSFFLGSLCYTAFLKMKDKSIPLASVLELTLIIGIYLFVVFAGANQYSLLAPFIFAIAVLVFSFEQGFISKLLKIKPIQDLGKWSYSIYMLHALIILIIGRVFNVIEKVFDKSFITGYSIPTNESVELLSIINPYFMDLLTILYLLALIYLASLTYKHIELKGSKLLKLPSKNNPPIEKNSSIQY